MKKEVTYIVPEKMTGKSISEFLQQQYRYSRAQIRSLKFRENGILMNGVQARATKIVHAGDHITLSLEDESANSFQLIPVPKELSVLYEDEDVICVWKEAGIPAHPAGMHYQDSLANYLMWYFQEKQEHVRIRSIGRLDLDTAGIMVYAKTGIGAARLWKQKEEGVLVKEYQALCEGRFPREAFEKEQYIDLPLAEKDPYTMCVSANGKEAHTKYLVLEEKRLEDERYVSLVNVTITTGRMHQIRVHMAAIGHPLTGDPIYGNGQRGKDHAMLCAWKVTFRHPFLNKLTEVVAEKEKMLDVHMES